MQDIGDKIDTCWFKDGDFNNHKLNENNMYITEKYIESIFKKYNLNHEVKNLEMFQLAMIHVSYLERATITEKTAKMLKDVIPITSDNRHLAMPLKKIHYGRLEYLGDAKIHDVLARYLYLRYPEEGEGFLTKLRTKLEKDTALFKLSHILGLPKYAIIARNMEQANARETNLHLAEDLFESFIGALSLELSHDKCDKFIMSIMETEMDIAELIHTDDNYKDQLMRHFHKLKLGDPKYEDDVSLQKNIKEGCIEIRSYTTYVKKTTGKIIGVGEGPTKAVSEQNAAYNSLVNIGVINEADDEDSDYYGEESDCGDDSDDSDDSESDGSDNSESDYFEEK